MHIVNTEGSIFAGTHAFGVQETLRTVQAIADADAEISVNMEDNSRKDTGNSSMTKSAESPSEPDARKNKRPRPWLWLWCLCYGSAVFYKFGRLYLKELSFLNFQAASSFITGVGICKLGSWAVFVIAASLHDTQT